MSLNTDPSVTVIIPTFNRADFLKDAIESVLKQNYSPIELIIVDDGSTDGTRALVDTYQSRLKYIFQENKGVAAARNRGIAESSGSHIAFLDSDDRFGSKKIAIQLAAMQQNPSYLISHTQEKWYRRGKFLNQKKKHRKEGGYLFLRCLELCAVGMSTIMVRKELFDTVGLFNEDLPCCEDYDLWLRTSVSLPFLLVDSAFTVKNGGRPDQLSVRYQVGMDAYRIQSILSLIESGALDDVQMGQAAQELVRKATILGNGYLKHRKRDQAEYYLDLAKQYTPAS